MTCPTCGTQAPQGAKFCASCGTDLSQRDERRIVTVVFADIVGFTKMAEMLDPERVKNLVDESFQQLRQDIEAFGGRVDKIVGDGILALFGAPTAHEDDAERAVRAALRMQETVAEYGGDRGTGLQLRIGVNTGEVLVGAIRVDGDYTAMGDVVNTASRLQSMAEPGTVLVGAATEAATRTSISYEPLGASEVRGRAAGVDVFRAIAPIGLPGARVNADGPLIGRSSEQLMLSAAINTALTTQRAHMLLILGDAGVGKSRLAREIAERAKLDHGVAVLSGRCVPYGEANAWFPLAEAVRTSLELPDDASADQVAEVATRDFTQAFGLTADDPTIIRARDALLHLLGHASNLSTHDVQSTTDEAGRAIRMGFQAAVRHQPIVLWLTDLHWADHVVLDLIDDMLNRMSRTPFVIIATARHSLTDDWIPKPSRSNVITVSLEPLTDQDSRRFLEQLIGTDLPESVATEIVSRSGGNPFFLQELGGLVLAEGIEAIDDVPSTVRGLVAARLDSLNETERSALEDAAVLGRRGSVGALRTMGQYTGGDPALITEGIQGLIAKDILVVRHSAWEFRSNMVRDVAYERLTKSHRAEMHAGVAKYLEDNDSRNIDTIAFHYRRAASLIRDIGPTVRVPDDVRTRAIERTVDAAAAARFDKSNAVVLQLLSEALDLAGDDVDTRNKLLLDRAHAHLDDRAADRARADIAAVMQAGATGALAASVEALQGELAQRGGDVDGAIHHYEAAYEMFLREGDEPGAAGALRQMGLTYMTHGRSDHAEDAFQRALDAQIAAGDRVGEAWTRQNLAWLSYSAGETGLAEKRILAAIEVFNELHDLPGASYCEGLLAYVRLHQGRREESRALAEKVLVNAREGNERWGEAMTLVLIGSLELWSGHPDVAAQYGESALRIFRDLSEPIGRFQAVAVMTRALVRSGRQDEGFRMLRAATQSSGLSTATGLLRQARIVGAAASVTVGDPEAALRWLGPVDLAGTDLDSIGGSDLLVAFGLASLQLGNDEDAYRTLQQAVKPDIEGVQSANAMSALALAELAVGNVDAVHTLVAAVDRSQRATYIDRQLATIAAIGASLRVGDDEAAIAGVDHLAELLLPTTDRMAELLFRIVEARVHTVVGTPASATINERAKRVSATIGAEGSSWVTLVDRLLIAG